MEGEPEEAPVVGGEFDGRAHVQERSRQQRPVLDDTDLPRLLLDDEESRITGRRCQEHGAPQAADHRLADRVRRLDACRIGVRQLHLAGVVVAATLAPRAVVVVTTSTTSTDRKPDHHRQ
jgi:hypothetical protein